MSPRIRSTILWIRVREIRGGSRSGDVLQHVKHAETRESGGMLPQENF